MFRNQVKELLKKHSNEDMKDRNPELLEDLYDTVTLLRHCSYTEIQSMKPEYKKNLSLFLRVYDNEINEASS